MGQPFFMVYYKRRLPRRWGLPYMEQQAKFCVICGQSLKGAHYTQTSGKRDRHLRQRYICQQCRTSSMPASNRRKRKLAAAHRGYNHHEHAQLTVDKLRPTWQGFVRMRGKSDSGGRWIQEIDVVQAKVLVREGAAVMLNPYTIRMLYSHKEFKRFILTRDEHTCFYCGQYGDTIDHLLPRAKGGYTTPVNCVCACLNCNQQKGNLTLDQFKQEQPQLFIAQK